MKRVYIIWWAEEFACKIGISEAPRSRLHEGARAWNPYLTLDYFSPLIPDAWAVEKQIHAHLKKAGRHWYGEWFKISKEEARELVEGLAGIKFTGFKEMVG